ncbi:MAG: response regulator [Acetatifactor sp.]|nr:response regulator [Acetatifactor sp.]
MNALKREDPDALVPVFVFSSKPYVTDVAGLIVRNITRFVTLDFYIGKAVKCDKFSYSQLSCQELSGDESIFIAIAEETQAGAFAQVASEFSHISPDSSKEDACDSVCEFINVTSGLLASSLSKQNISVDLEPPQAYLNQCATGEFYDVPIYLEDKILHLLIAVNAPFKAGETPVVIEADHAKKVKKHATGKTSVLLVDDSKMSRSMLREILEAANYTVVMEATNGLEGLEAYKKCNPDIVTLDITMPQMDGLELLRKILDYDPDAKAIMITAAGQQDKLIEALKCGAKRFISKPFNAEEILINMSDVLEY